MDLNFLDFIPEPPRTFHQLGILLLDGSDSMKGEKANEVVKAVHSLFQRMEKSTIKHNFSFAAIAFASNTKQIFPITYFKELDYNNINFNPCDYVSGETYINSALQVAEKLANDFLSNPETDLPHSVVILLMTDGLCHNTKETKQIAKRLKRNPNIKIACAYFSEKNTDYEYVLATQLLKKISSGLPFFSTVNDGESLRSFFESSISNSLNIGTPSPVEEEEKEELPMILDIEDFPPTDYLLLFVLDGSNSIKELGKGNIISEFVRSLLHYHATRHTKHTYHLAAIAFSEKPKVILTPTPLTGFSYETFDFNPTNYVTGEKYIHKALEEANRIAKKFIGLPSLFSKKLKYVNILLYTDGLCKNPELTEKIAKQINQKEGRQIEVFFFSQGLGDKEKPISRTFLQNVAAIPEFLYEF